LIIVVSNSQVAEEMYRFGRNSHVSYKYDRIDEVQKQCVSVLSASSELRFGYRDVIGMKGELSFVNGDLITEDGKFPIMPFDDSNGSFSAILICRRIGVVVQ
jgi:hypothetical protein